MIVVVVVKVVGVDAGSVICGCNYLYKDPLHVVVVVGCSYVGRTVGDGDGSKLPNAVGKWLAVSVGDEKRYRNSVMVICSCRR